MNPQELFEHAKKHGVTLRDPGDVTDMQEYIEGQQPFDGFTLICNKCSSKNIQLKTENGYVSEAGTGYPTEITLRCRECGFTSIKE